MSKHLKEGSVIVMVTVAVVAVLYTVLIVSSLI